MTNCIFCLPNGLSHTQGNIEKFAESYRILIFDFLSLNLQNMINLRNIHNFVIILLFAALHFGVAAISRALEYYDDILLTILTITMVIIISMRNNVRVELMAIMTMVTTLLGYIIGTWLQEPMATFIPSTIFAPALSTFIVTTVLGITTDNITSRTKRYRNREQNFAFSTTNILGIAVSILILRLGYTVMDRADIFPEGMVLENVLDILGNSWALLLLAAGNVALSIRTTPKHDIRHKSNRKIWTLILVSTLTITLLTASIIYFDIPHFSTPLPSLKDFIRIFSAALLIDLIIMTLCHLMMIYITSQRELREERELKHRTEYSYERLKQQITPHFLFNSLGILDYLVQEHETERASAFIHKFADIYRYMLSNDQKNLVKVSEELEFTMKYIDLLKERFTEGMLFEIEIEEREMSNYVVPCSLQLLVENAAKHNIVSADTPLRMKITTEDGFIVARNNLQPRTHGQPSTHLGLANIRQQYLDVAGREISVEKNESEFIVKLPIV